MSDCPVEPLIHRKVCWVEQSPPKELLFRRSERGSHGLEMLSDANRFVADAEMRLIKQMPTSPSSNQIALADRMVRAIPLKHRRNVECLG
jgi:hypothetical protein